MAAATADIRIRINPDTKSVAQAAAKADGRTLSNYIIHLIEQDIHERRSEKNAD